MTDLDYAKVIGRFGLTVGDTGTDPDDDPDTVWCTEGRVIITPLNTFVKVASGSPVPWTGGNAQIECAIDGNGYLTYTPPGGTTKQFVEVVDLTSSKVNPQITTGATHRVTFADVKSGTTPVAFPTFTCRLTAAGDGVSGAGINDLTIVAPIVPGEALPITRGPQGVSIESLAVNGLGELEVQLDDGTTVNAGDLPVGPGGSDAGVAGYLSTPASASRAALDDATADLLDDPTSAVAIKTSASIDARVPNVAIPTWQAGQTVAAGVLRRDPSGNLITRISSGTTGSTYNGTEAAAWRKDGDGYSTVAGLPTSGIVLAHRGAESIWPEETDLAFAGAIAGGADALEMDCQLLADGALAVIHDDTVDRTTTSTGSVSTYSSMAWKNLVCDPSSWLGPGWPNVTGLPLLRETLAKYGRQTILMVEPKTGASVDKAITDVLATGTQDTVILEASALADLTKIKAAGLYAYYYWPTTVGSPVSVASVVSAGANFLGGPVSLSDADITTLVATGKPVIIYGANRQYDKARLDALGVAGYMVGDPAYIKGAHTPVLTDRFSELIRQHGLITTTSDSTMTLVSPNKLTLSAGSQQGVVLGHMSPIANRAGTFSLSADVCYETLPAGTNVLELSIATTDINYPVRNYSGYSATLYKDGTLRIFKHVELGSSTLISGSIATPALTAGGFATLKLDVTPTTVKVTRDGNATYSATVTDSTYRGGFIHFSKNAADASASIRNVTVS